MKSSLSLKYRISLSSISSSDEPKFSNSTTSPKNFINRRFLLCSQASAKMSSDFVSQYITETVTAFSSDKSGISKVKQFCVYNVISVVFSSIFMSFLSVLSSVFIISYCYQYVDIVFKKINAAVLFLPDVPPARPLNIHVL